MVIGSRAAIGAQPKNPAIPQRSVATAHGHVTSNTNMTPPKHPTLRDVAKKARVSAMTVSRVINRNSAVRADTQHRVERAIEELHYVPNVMARGLLSSKSGTLGLIIPDIVNPFFTMIVRGAETTARRAGYRILLCNSESDLTLERDYVAEMISHRVEGLLIAPVGEQSKTHLLPLMRRGFPVVLIDRAVRGAECDTVQGDNVAGARELTDHLLGIGHRTIAMIVEQGDVSTARDRRQGYLEAMAAAGLSISPGLIQETTADRLGGYRAAMKILRLEPCPTAVFAVNNMTVMGAMQAIREGGLLVPDDMALVCFDDVEHLAVVAPFLTVMNQPTEMFGTVASTLLLERLKGSSGDQPRRVVLAPELIVRESCGAKGRMDRRIAAPSNRLPS
jgi:LacI family transcriptional regulator